MNHLHEIAASSGGGSGRHCVFRNSNVDHISILTPSFCACFLKFVVLKHF